MKESSFEWEKGYASNVFAPDKLFMHTFKKYPNKFVYQLGDDEFDLDNSAVEILRKKYPNAIIKVTNVKNNRKTSCVDSDEEEDPLVFVNGTMLLNTIKVFDDHKFILLESDSVIIYYTNLNPEEEFKELYSLLPLKKDESKKAVVGLVAYSSGDYYTVDSKIEPTTVDIQANYNDDFLPVYNDIIKFLDERKSGLVVLRGEVGTGKTQLIKNLITNHPKEYVLITNSVSSSLASPEFISFMLSCKNSVFILEDCEQVLLERGTNSLNSAISNILNISDGIMSDIFNIKFICTFNADINKIDKALLRKGRCFANYEFKKLCVEKTKNLLNSLGITLDNYKEMTLAEIYNYEDTNCDSQSKTNKIGFNVS